VGCIFADLIKACLFCVVANLESPPIGAFPNKRFVGVDARCFEDPAAVCAGSGITRSIESWLGSKDGSAGH